MARGEAGPASSGLVLPCRILGGMCSFPKCGRKVPQTLQFKQQEFILGVLEAEVQNQVVAGRGTLRRLQGWSLLPLSASDGPMCSWACGCIIPVSASILTWSPLSLTGHLSWDLGSAQEIQDDLTLEILH